MSYTVNITEMYVTSVVLDSKEEAEQFMSEPDYDLCSDWEWVDSNFELVK